MRHRALIHVAGPDGAGKTAFVEGILRDIDGPILAARCVCDDTLRRARESAPKTDPELRRYRKAGATGTARFSFPKRDADFDAFFMTDLMDDYSEAVVLEGDNPLGLADLSVFVAPPLPTGGRLFVRRTRDRAKEERAKADAMERMLQEPDGVAQFLDGMVGGPIAEWARKRPAAFEETRVSLLAGIAAVRKAPPPGPTRHWALAERYHGIERAQLVIVNVRSEAERGRGERLVGDLGRLRQDDLLFQDILGLKGNRIPITAVVANLADGRDPGYRKALARTKRVVRRLA